jgi:hypothetical protein
VIAVRVYVVGSGGTGEEIQGIEDVREAGDRRWAAAWRGRHLDRGRRAGGGRGRRGGLLERRRGGATRRKDRGKEKDQTPWEGGGGEELLKEDRRPLEKEDHRWRWA